jgi:hypothetical protein
MLREMGICVGCLPNVDERTRNHEYMSIHLLASQVVLYLPKLTYYGISRGRMKNFVLVVTVAFVIALNWSELSRQKMGCDKDINFHCNESLQGS